MNETSPFGCDSILNPSLVKPSKNIAAQWFQASEASGDFMGIRYGRKAADSEEVKWSFVSHCECDGIGGFVRLLRESGAAISELPTTNYPNRGIIRPLWNLWRKKPYTGATAERAGWCLSPQQAQHGTNKPEVFAYHLFTEEETSAIRQNCRQQKTTVNSFLLKQLDQAVRPDIKKSTAAIPWMIPVNLRGDLNYDDTTENHVSCVQPVIAANDSAEDIQQQIYNCLKRGEHRANYLMLCVGKLMSHQTKMRWIAKMRRKPKGNIGAFSNLGVWDSEKTIETKDSWFFCPPVCTGQLLGAGCVTFQNQFSLTIQAHSALSDHPEIANNWMNRWVSGIL